MNIKSHTLVYGAVAMVLFITVGQSIPVNGTNSWTNSSSPNASFYRLEAIENP